VRPQPGQTVCDPAAGTGGFLLAAHDYVVNNYQLNKRQKEALRFDALRGWEIVDATARLCVMNLYLHGVGGEESPIRVGDSLASDPGETFNVVLTNPPFGKKSSITVIGDDLTPKSGSFNYEPWLWAGIAVGVIAGLFIAYTRPNEEVGDRLAVKNNRRRSRGLGWDTLFTRKEREKLR
jgi:hypothetical protein